jgi:glycosyltransferase involved in cell wall biosynthesis
VTKYSVLIATYNRAGDLRDTLSSLASLQPDGPWEVIVIDNNSSDETRLVVESSAPGFPAPLRYCFEQKRWRFSTMATSRWSSVPAFRSA